MFVFRCHKIGSKYCDYYNLSIVDHQDQESKFKCDKPQYVMCIMYIVLASTSIHGCTYIQLYLAKCFPFILTKLKTLKDNIEHCSQLFDMCLKVLYFLT